MDFDDLLISNSSHNMLFDVSHERYINDCEVFLYLFKKIEVQLIGFALPEMKILGI